MLFLNRWEIDDARSRHQRHPVLGRATQILANLRDIVDENSDGWAYWAAPVRAAKQLQELIKNPADATEANLKKALTPIKAFLTRHARNLPSDAADRIFGSPDAEPETPSPPITDETLGLPFDYRYAEGDSINDPCAIVWTTFNGEDTLEHVCMVNVANDDPGGNGALNVAEFISDALNAYVKTPQGKAAWGKVYKPPVFLYA